MLAHVAEELAALVDLCSVQDEGEINGWSVDVWEFDAASLRALSEVYEALLLGGLEAEIESALEADGVDVRALLFDDEGSIEMITRSDLTELAAAAAAIGIDQWPTETMHLPNVPKGSRARSEVGIDILAVRMDFEADTDDLLPQEMLFIGSVKHTIDSPGDCRYKLAKSVSASDLTHPYVAQQLRIFAGNLAVQGVATRRLYLFLRGFPNNDHVAVTITGGVDSSLKEAFLRQLRHLPEVEGERVCRLLDFPDIDTLHELLDDH